MQKVYSWLKGDDFGPCILKVQVSRGGGVSLIHSPPAGTSDGAAVPAYLQVDSGSGFTVRWEDNKFPLASDNCGGEDSCVVHGETCVCEVSVQTTAPFLGSDVLPSRIEVILTPKPKPERKPKLEPQAEPEPKPEPESKPTPNPNSNPNTNSG